MGYFQQIIIDSVHNMRYLGSKETLADAIKLLLQNHNLLQKHLVFFDAFCGMGSVADSMKPIYDHIVINDSLKCATIFTRGKLYANRCTFERLGFDPFTFFNENSNTIYGFFIKTIPLEVLNACTFQKKMLVE